MSDTTRAQAGLPDDWQKKLKANDEKLLQWLYTENFTKVEKYILDNNGTEADAGDIYQEAFVTVWRKMQLNNLVFETLDKFHGYLFRVAQYKWLDQLRTTKRQKMKGPMLMPAIEPDLERDEEQDQYLLQVKKEFNELGEPCKELLYRFYFRRQSLLEIAAVFSWTEATAKNNKYRCLQRLRNKINPVKKTEP